MSVPSRVRLLFVLAAAALSLYVTARASDIYGLTGVWTNPQGRKIRIHQDGTSLRLHPEGGPLFIGTIVGKQIRLRRSDPDAGPAPFWPPEGAWTPGLPGKVIEVIEGSTESLNTALTEALTLKLFTPGATVNYVDTYTKVKGSAFCPKFLLRAVLDDADRSISCLANVSPPAGLRPADGPADVLMEKYLRAHPEMLNDLSARVVARACQNEPGLSRYNAGTGFRARSSGVRESDVLDALIAPAAPVEPRNPHALPGASARPARDLRPEIQRRVDKATPEREEILKILAVEYYWSKKRLTDGVLASFETIAAMESLEQMSCKQEDLGTALNERFLRSLQCQNYGNVIGGQATCLDVKQRCPDRVNHGRLLEQTKFADLLLPPMRAELGAARSRLKLAQTDPRGVFYTPQEREEAERIRSVEPARIAQLESGIQVIESSFPWVTGEKYLEAYADENRTCKTRAGGPAWCVPACKGIKAEAAAIRATAEQQLATFVQALECLDSEDGSCTMDIQTFRAAVNTAPALAGLKPVSPDSQLDRAHARYVGNELSLAHCRSEVRGSQNTIDEIKREFLIASTLTVATAGLSSWATGIRTASLAAQTVQEAALQGRLARVLRISGVVIEFADTARSIANSIAECNRSFALGEQMEPAAEGRPRCPSADVTPGAPSGFNYSDCVLQAVVMDAAIHALSSAPALYARFADESLIRRASEALGVQRLNNSQRSALLTVFGSGWRTLSPDELAKAVSALRAAEFDNRQITELFSRFSPNDLRLVGSELVGGLRGRPIADAHLAFAGESHHLVLRRAPDGSSLVTLCSYGCESIVGLIDDVLEYAENLPEQARRRLSDLRNRIEGIQTSSGLEPDAAKQQLGECAAELGQVVDKDPTGAVLAALRIAAGATKKGALVTWKASETDAYRLLKDLVEGDLVKEPVFKDGTYLGFSFTEPTLRSNVADARLGEIAATLGYPKDRILAASTSYWNGLDRAAKVEECLQAIRNGEFRNSAIDGIVQQLTDDALRFKLQNAPDLVQKFLDERALKHKSELVKEINDRFLNGHTRPDFLGEEWRDGRLVNVAWELKTPEETVLSFFADIITKKKSLSMYEHFFNQLSQRSVSKSAVNELIIDLRNTWETVEETQLAIRKLIEDPAIKEYRALKQVYPTVRFIIGEANNPVLTKSLPLGG